VVKIVYTNVEKVVAFYYPEETKKYTSIRGNSHILIYHYTNKFITIIYKSDYMCEYMCARARARVRACVCISKVCRDIHGKLSDSK